MTAQQFFELIEIHLPVCPHARGKCRLNLDVDHQVEARAGDPSPARKFIERKLQSAPVGRSHVQSLTWLQHRDPAKRGGMTEHVQPSEVVLAANLGGDRRFGEPP